MRRCLAISGKSTFSFQPGLPNVTGEKKEPWPDRDSNPGRLAIRETTELAGLSIPSPPSAA